jgi:hypothetical protein
MALPPQSENVRFHVARRGHGNEAQRFESTGAPAGVKAQAGKGILTRKEKEHIRTETKPIVIRASLFENWARASREGVDEAVNKRLPAATAWQRSYQAERA